MHLGAGQTQLPRLSIGHSNLPPRFEDQTRALAKRNDQQRVDVGFEIRSRVPGIVESGMHKFPIGPAGGPASDCNHACAFLAAGSAHVRPTIEAVGCGTANGKHVLPRLLKFQTFLWTG